MSQAFKLLCPDTGTVTAFDCITGVELTAEQLAASYDCTAPEAHKTDVCIQLIGNEDKALVYAGYCISVITVDAVTFACTVQKTSVFDSTMTDVTATHEVVKCPANPVPVGTVCYQGEGK